MVHNGGRTNNYVYTSGGAKLQVKSTANNVTTDYAGNKVYENGSLKKILVEGGYYDAVQRKYFFYVQDHLGNNRVLADANGIVHQRSDFYPYGKSFGSNLNPTAQPYLYNGKELDNTGLDWYDYGARMLSAERWTTVDPMAEKYYAWSPYNYTLGNPIRFVDPDGRQPRGKRTVPETKISFSIWMSFGPQVGTNIDIGGVSVGTAAQIYNIEGKTELGIMHNPENGWSGIATYNSTEIKHKTQARIGVPTLGYGVESSETLKTGDHEAFSEVNKTETKGLVESSTMKNHKGTTKEEKSTFGVSAEVNAFIIGFGVSVKVETKDVPKQQSITTEPARLQKTPISSYLYEKEHEKYEQF